MKLVNASILTIIMCFTIIQGAHSTNEHAHNKPHVSSRQDNNSSKINLHKRQLRGESSLSSIYGGNDYANGLEEMKETEEEQQKRQQQLKELRRLGRLEHLGTNADKGGRVGKIRRARQH
jgi:hypothetical protein